MSFAAEVNSMPSYIIYRDIPADQPFDITAPLAFFPAKDSDELFDALRVKYPHLRTHSERTRQAVIEYLMQEETFPSSLDQLPTPQTAPSLNYSPWEASMQSMSSESSTWSSPELFDLATPLFGNSPQPQSQALTRQHSTSTAAPSVAQSTPPALEQMTGVFSLADHSQPKQRVRRKMTEAEKAEYRRRRIVKACDKCSKRKRKCNHNQPEMENLTSQTHKVAKSSPTSQGKTTVQKQQKPQQQQLETSFGSDVSFFEPSFIGDVPMPSFDDFTMLPEDPINAIDPTQLPLEQWQDYSPFNNTMDGSNLGYEYIHNPSLQQFTGLESAPIPGDSFSAMEPLQGTQQPTHTHHVHESYGLAGADLIGLNNSFPTNQQPQLLRDPAVQRTRHASSNSTEQQTIHENATLDGGSGRYPSLADMTLRLNGTKKALAAFGKLLPTTSASKSRLQSVSLRKIAMIALGSLSIAQASGSGSTIQPPQLSMTVAGYGGTSRYPCPSCDKQFSIPSSLKRHTLSHLHVAPDRWDDLCGTQLNSGLVSIQSGSENIQSESSGNSSGVNRRATLLDNSRSSSGDDGDIPIPVPLKSPKYHQVKTHARSLGEGSSIMKSPHTELYMLKRGIPSSGLSTLSRTDTTPLNRPLMTIPTLNEVPPTTQVNGGAYLRLDGSAAHDVLAAAGATAGTGSLRRTESGANAATPVHTRPNATTSNGFADISTAISRFSYSGPSASGRWSMNGQGSEAAHNAIAAPSAQAASENRTPAMNEEVVSALHSRLGWSGSSASGHWHMNGQGTEEARNALGTDSAHLDFAYRTPTHNEVVNYRLSDHFRCRDHFGRMAVTATMELAVPVVVICSLFSLSLVRMDTSTFATGSLSFMLLALLQPVSSDFDKHHIADTSFPSRTPVDDSLFGSVTKHVGNFLGRALKIGGRGRINSIGKKAI